MSSSDTESILPASPRKRRRSLSADTGRQRKRAVSITPYNDAYRLLYNDFVRTITSYPDSSKFTTYKPSQLGATVWTASEKEAFFQALERLGKDNLPGIAAAVGSKSLLETRQLLLLLQDATFERAGKRDIALKDIPAASEIGIALERQLDAAGDTLASKQDRFEATQEQKRYGEHWLITSTLADEIELAASPSQAPVPVESGEDEDRQDGVGSSSLLHEIPEARLIIPKAFLELSRNVFMNPSPNSAYPWSHWQDLTSDLAPEPCMYRTAFRDFYALVLSFTKRVIQTAIVQATSRIRAQGWRIQKGVKLFVRSRDVRTATDLLGVKAGRRQYWRGVPRRCRLKVTYGKYRKLRAFRWDEIERILDASESKSAPIDSDTDADSHGAQTDQVNFKARAIRSGTPLPTARQPSSDDTVGDNSVEVPEENTDSDVDKQLDDSLEMSDGPATNEDVSDYGSSEDENEGLEEFDREVNQLEEYRLWSIIGDAPAEDRMVKPEPSEQSVHKIPRRKIMTESDDWRTWTEYRSEWEETRSQVPLASFLANQKSTSPPQPWDPATDYETDYGTETGISSGGDHRPRKRLPIRTVEELPLRDPRSYAALRGRQTQSAERREESHASEDEAVIPAQSVEDADESDVRMSAGEDGDPIRSD